MVPANTLVLDKAARMLVIVNLGQDLIAKIAVTNVTVLLLVPLSVPAANTASKIAGATAEGSLIQATSVAGATTGAISASTRRVIGMTVPRIL